MERFSSVENNRPPVKSSMMRDLVSVMMPAYNAERFIGQAIESVLAQVYPLWELIVVNDGSTDHTAEIVLRYPDLRIKLIHKENGGEASARNTALQYMQGEFVAFLDADDMFLPLHLETAVQYMQSHPNCHGIYTDGYYCDQNGFRLQTLSSRRRGPFEGDIFEEVVRSSDVFGPPVCVILRREIINHHQLRFDPRIVIGPDWDFLTHYAQAACFGYIQDPTCLYRLHGANITFQVNLKKRASYLAICREKAINLSRFQECSLEVRRFVFYDLLVNLLTGDPQHQSAILEGSEFKALPVGAQAQILRLMASQSVLQGIRQPVVNDWIQLSQMLNPEDRRGALLGSLYRLNPAFCRLFLQLKTLATFGRRETSLFGKLG